MAISKKTRIPKKKIRKKKPSSKKRTTKTISTPRKKSQASNKSAPDKTKTQVNKIQSTGRVRSKKKKIEKEDDSFSHLEEPIEAKENSIMSIGDHLEELRKRIIAIVAVVIVTAIGVGFFSPQMHKILLDPFISITGAKLIMSRGYGGLLIMMKLSVLLGVVATLPICFSIMWGFVTPAVERKTAFLGHLVVAISGLLFWAGVLVCWFYIYPLSLKFLFVDTRLFGVEATHPVEAYYSLLFTLHLSSGITFQLPLVLIILGALGIITMDWHKRFWKYILVGIFLFAAILTPPDPISQVFLGGILSLLYGFSVIVVFLIEKTRKIKTT